MTEREFCYWLQGFFEMRPDAEPISGEQSKAIKEHLALVFTKITPSFTVTDAPSFVPLAEGHGTSQQLQGVSGPGVMNLRAYC